MSLPGSYEIIISALGKTIQSNSAHTLSAKLGIEPVSVVIPAAQALTNWVKTDANAGSGNLAEGHELSDGKFDVFWPAGKRYDVAGDIEDNVLSLAGGAGDDFPPTASPDVVVCPAQSFDVTFDGDNLVVIGAKMSRDGLLCFWDAEDAIIGEPQRLLADRPWGWAIGRGSNPVSGNAVAAITVSCSDREGTSTFDMTGLQYPA